MKKFIIMATIITSLAGCAENGEFGLANHPVDCAFGYYHSDCLPGTAGYKENTHKYDGTTLNEADTKVEQEKREAVYAKEKQAEIAALATDTSAKLAGRAFTLVCTLNRYGTSKNYTVNLDASTVNGLQAEISDTMIEWYTPSTTPYGIRNSLNDHLTINRINGAFNYVGNPGRCYKATKRMF